MVTASYLRNRITSGDLKVTPYEMFYGKKPDVSHLRVYGCKAFAYVEKDQRDKLVWRYVDLYIAFTLFRRA